MKELVESVQALRKGHVAVHDTIIGEITCVMRNLMPDVINTHEENLCSN